MQAARLGVAIGTILAVGALSAAYAGCDDSPKRPVPMDPPAPIGSMAQSLGLDASTLEIEPADPPPQSGNLRDELERFTTLDACVKERGKLDPVLGDAMRAVGYETFTRDACRVLDALKSRDAKKCAGITSGALERHCAALVAIGRQSADECPWENDRFKSSGRQPFCVAAASHDPRLCAAEIRTARISCEALCFHEEKRCEALLESERAECKRKVARYQSLVEAPDAKSTPLAKVEGTLTLTAVADTKSPPTPTVDAALDVARGIVLVEERAGTRVLLGSLEYDSPTSLPTSGVRRARMAFELLVDKTGAAKVERAELDLPGETPLLCPGTTCSLRVTVKKLDRMRAGAATFDIEGRVGSAPKGFDVKWSASTFVRDIANVSSATTPGSVLFGGPRPTSTTLPVPAPSSSF